jgi:predicted nucleic-acid-binding protein
VIGLDTNVLVRYFTQDDSKQSPRATRLIERQLSAEIPGFISVVAMTELVWVLQRAYRFAAGEIADAIEGMLAADTLAVECEQEVFQAMVALKDGNGSFSDALVSALGTKAGCSRTVTFDEKALRLPGFVRVGEA